MDLKKQVKLASEILYRSEGFAYTARVYENMIIDMMYDLPEEKRKLYLEILKKLAHTQAIKLADKEMVG